MRLMYLLVLQPATWRQAFLIRALAKHHALTQAPQLRDAVPGGPESVPETLLIAAAMPAPSGYVQATVGALCSLLCQAKALPSAHHRHRAGQPSEPCLALEWSHAGAMVHGVCDSAKCVPGPLAQQQAPQLRHCLQHLEACVQREATMAAAMQA